MGHRPRACAGGRLLFSGRRMQSVKRWIGARSSTTPSRIPLNRLITDSRHGEVSARLGGGNEASDLAGLAIGRMPNRRIERC
jgi:hypothetical protein